ncbi:hypothetical protein AHAS_Ahas03G0245300 [Arachis hypogaea]
MVNCKYLPLLSYFWKSGLTVGDRHVWHIYISPCVGSRVMIRRRWMAHWCCCTSGHGCEFHGLL